jgi:hypothetical protein
MNWTNRWCLPATEMIVSVTESSERRPSPHRRGILAALETSAVLAMAIFRMLRSKLVDRWKYATFTRCYSCSSTFLYYFSRHELFKPADIKTKMLEFALRVPSLKGILRLRRMMSINCCRCQTHSRRAWNATQSCAHVKHPLCRVGDAIAHQEPALFT